jgi:hypothetical protein
MILPNLLVSLFGRRPGRSSNARVERAHSYRARFASKRTTRPASPPPPSSFVILPLQVCDGWKGWARRWRHSGKQCLVAVPESVRRHCAVSARFYRSARRMSRRPTARRNHHIMSPPTLPALRQPHPSLSLQARLLLSLGMAPVLVPLRPSSEHILIVRAPGARDQHGCHSTPFLPGYPCRQRCRSHRFTWQGCAHRPARPYSLSPRDGDPKTACSVCRHG